jgi:glycosyltransferase involved in cell wall biosynthesis
MVLVSVIIPVYNSEKTITETINSVLNQTYKNIEIIIINDGSTDSSEKEILSFNDQRLIYIYQENQGSPNAKNTGLTIAKGKYIQFLDADDLLSIDKIENQVKLLDGKIDAVCVCKTYIFYDTSELENNNHQEIDSEFLLFSTNPLEFLLNLNGINGKVGMVQPNAYLTPSSIINKAGHWSPLLNRSPDDDSEFFCRVLLNSKEIIHDNSSINYYRKSINSLSGGKSLLHAMGALKTMELKSRSILERTNSPKVKNALANGFAKVAYDYGSYHPEIIFEVSKLLFSLLGYNKIPNVGGKYFKLLSRIIGFENTFYFKNKVIRL